VNAFLVAQYVPVPNLSPKVPTRSGGTTDADLVLAMKLQQQFDDEARSGAKSGARPGSSAPPPPAASYPGNRSGPDTSKDEDIARALQEEENQKSEGSN
jgi:hypothetical protein